MMASKFICNSYLSLWAPLPKLQLGSEHSTGVRNIVVVDVVTKWCPTLCNPMDLSIPGFSFLHCLPELAQTYVHRVSDAIQPSHHLSPPSPPVLSLSQHQGLSSELALCISIICSVVSKYLQPHGLKLTSLLCPWGFPAKNTGVGCHFLLWGIFPTQGSNSGLLHCRLPSEPPKLKQKWLTRGHYLWGNHWTHANSSSWESRRHCCHWRFYNIILCQEGG